MSEDASVNIDAVAWPEPDVAYFAVRKMQIKLHRWAGDDSSRRFGDLFNLVSDPAFLMRLAACVIQRWGKESGYRQGHGGLDRVLDRGGGVFAGHQELAEIGRVRPGRSAAGIDTQAGDE